MVHVLRVRGPCSESTWYIFSKQVTHILRVGGQPHPSEALLLPASRPVALIGLGDARRLLEHLVYDTLVQRDVPTAGVVRGVSTLLGSLLRLEQVRVNGGLLRVLRAAQNLQGSNAKAILKSQRKHN